MKKIITILLAVMMLLALTACGSKTVDTPAGGKDNEKSMTLTQSGTGELKLKDFIESSKIVNKSWTEATINEVKTRYNVNYENKNTTLMGGDEDIRFYGKDTRHITREIDGVEVVTYDETVSVRYLYGTEMQLTSYDVGIDEEMPSTTKIQSVSYIIVANAPDLTPEIKQIIMNRVGEDFSFIGKNECFTLVDILNTLGMQETDKTVYEAIEKGLEYEAYYNTEYGEVSLEYYEYGDTKTVEFVFMDDNAIYSYIDISEISQDVAEGTYSEIVIDIIKK